MSDRNPFAIPLGTAYGPLGFTLRSVTPGHAVWEYRVDKAHFNPNGVLHGGVVMSLLDTAMGFAVTSTVLEKGRYNAAAEMTTHFLAPIREGVVTAEGKVVKVGKRLAVVDGRATDSSGTLVAIATATHALLP